MLDVEGAYLDIKKYLKKMEIHCGNCIHFDLETDSRKSVLCNDCYLESHWRFNPIIIKKIEQENTIEDEIEIGEEKESTVLICPVCGDIMNVDTEYRLASYPPKYEAFCKCGHNSYIRCDEYVE